MDAVSSSCQKVCTSRYREMANSTGNEILSFDKIRNCLRGCYFALDAYSKKIKSQLLPLKPLFLLKRNYSSLTLMWGTPIRENVTYKIHKRVVAMDTGWHLHENANFLPDGKIHLTNLQPYVTYKFKVMILVSSLPEYIMETRETAVITTSSHGAPSTAPEITSITTPSPWVIVLTWTEPPFTNDQLLGYKIEVLAVNQSILNPTTEEVPWDVTFYVMRQLLPSQQYIISVSANNSHGEGPKSSRTITTPSPDKSISQEVPYLILATSNKIAIRSFQDVVTSGSKFSTQAGENAEVKGLMEYVLNGGDIKGIGLHVRRELMLSTDSSGQVTWISLKNNSTRFNYYPSIRAASAISVDWLADRAYIVSTDKIYSCSLDEDLCVSVIQGLPETANDVKVDPINGFLYYVIKGKDQGLYRISLGDIAHLWTDGVPLSLSPTSPQLVIPMDEMRTLIIDFYNVRLLVVNSSSKTMMTSFLDGSGLQPFHEITVNCTHISSMVIHNQAFIWTDNMKIYVKNYSLQSENFQHKELMLTPPYADLNVLHSSAQPIPIPPNAPESIEALFTRSVVAIKWIPPAVLQYQGSGAWVNWTYELQISKRNQRGDLQGDPKEYNISGLSLTLSDLEPDNIYNIKVRARSTTGYGPWSTDIVGRTLKDDGLTVLMGVAGGQIVEKNIDHGTEQTLVTSYADIRDIDWHGDIVLWVTVSGSLFVYDRNTEEESELPTTNLVNCVAYDWLGHKVYWSELISKMIYRSDVSAISIESIYQTQARDIAIDAVNGRLYWATKYSIETSCLNGDDHQELFSLPLFSKQQILSLTVDMDSGKVLWFEKGYKSDELFMIDTIKLNNVNQLPAARIKGGEFKSIASNSGIQYYLQHMFWITEQDSLVIGDSQCNYSTNVSIYSNLTAFAVAHPLMHSYPSNSVASDLHVTANPIHSEDIHIEGVWFDFNLTWPRSTGVTHGIVFYKLLVEVGDNSNYLITSANFYEMSRVSPYTKLVVSIQPYTYWSYSDPTTVSMWSPMSVPTAPLSPEVYIKHHKNVTVSMQSLVADFRWMTPRNINGIIHHQLLTYWIEDESQIIVTLKSTARHFILTPLIMSKTYHFKVAACTEVGCGPESDTKTLNTKAPSQVPTLLMASDQGISLAEIDSDLNSTVILPDTSAKVVSFLTQEEPRIFWINMKDEVYESLESSIQQVVVLSGVGQDLTVDWISRTLYIVVSQRSGDSSIMQFHFDGRDYRLFLTRPAHIGSIIVDPYNSIIIWTELTSDGLGQIMKADTVGGEVQLFLGSINSRSRRSSDAKSCSCSLTLNVAPVIAMNYNDDGATEIIFADKVMGTIYSTDAMGCQCTRIIQPTSSNRFGLPPSLLAVDHMRVSWYNKTEGKIYSVNKTNGNGMVVHNINDVTDIQAYGFQLQPLPDSECLDPGVYNSSVEVVHVGNTSTILQLTPPIRPLICKGISSSQYKYTIYYRKVKAMKTGTLPEDCHTNLSVCHKQEFYTTSVELKNLKPFTQYLLQVAVSNYYTEYLSEALSEPLMMTTKFGIPGTARNVSVKPFTPEMISVEWWPPLEFNGPPDDINYVVQYSTHTAKGHIQKEINKMTVEEFPDRRIEVDLKGLEPDHFYNIRVLTCIVNKTMCSVTDPVQCKTFQTPSNISFVNATAHSLEIQWTPPPENEVSRHHTIYAEVKPGQLNWSEVNFLGVTSNNTEYREVVTSLQPNTLYAFRIRVNYHARPYNKAFYFWPPQETRFTYRTLVSHPEQPSAPTVTRLKSGAYEVKWEEPNSNGATIINYFLEYSSVDEGTWKTAYNGSHTSWFIETARMEHGTSYIFRVAAVNSEGIGPFSENSTVFLASLAMETNLGNHVTIGVVVGIIAFLAAVFFVIVCVLQKRCEKSKTQQFIIRGPDTELATLRELPYNTFQQSNTLYAVNIQCTDEEIAKLPHFGRNHLVLTMFLGSGAFGEVFEGLAKNILGDSTGETKCAVKTLRKSASDREKEEFLKEALLMKNFQHEHILSLLGVCLDNDPQFIIMELMEGGDLLSFLRSCRATTTTPAKLILPDLVKICLHVARGCRYLEDMHFVHRDLAARNCLVSTKSPADMIVKIGDFGLARDIYKNDYYRKEGEGLLPVRWMSPESLVDGFFTTQSDIWAFGVLMWEVITLGQQPYPARTNIEVLHFVRDRGKLERPEKCTDELYSLMSKCWSFHPSNRPCFVSLMEHIENLQEKCKQMTSAEIAHWSPSFKNANNDVLESLSEEEEEEEEPEEEAVTRGLFPPNSRILTGGGSVRLTQSGKQRRLNDLLGSLETPEMLVVDLTKAGRKRTLSLKESKHPLENSPSGVIANHFPAASEYGRNGYLEPRGTKGGGRYLELMNYAPELLHLRDSYGNPLFSGNGSAFLPVHVTHKGYHPSNANYTLLSPEEDIEDALCHKSAGNFSGSDVCGVEDPRHYTESHSDQSCGLVSVDESPVCSQVQDDLQSHSPRASEKYFEDYYHKSLLSPSSRTMVKLPPQRKYSDQDLYFSTAPYRQHRPSSSTSSQEHRYASVECNNNRSSTSNGNLSDDQTDACSNSDNGLIRDRHDSGGNFHMCTKPGLGHHLSMNLPASVEDDSSKLPSNRDIWASNLDNVFIDSGMTSECPVQLGNDIVNFQGHGHHSSKSRGQVYPEISTAVVGYEINQVSLV